MVLDLKSDILRFSRIKPAIDTDIPVVGIGLSHAYSTVAAPGGLAYPGPTK
jgi:hypothetical protein